MGRFATEAHNNDVAHNVRIQLLAMAVDMLKASNWADKPASHAGLSLKTVVDQLAASYSEL